MMKILQTEFDADYFDMFGEAFIKSFFIHNTGWRLHVLDFGLTDDQRSIVKRFGVTERASREKGNRWSTIAARIASLARLVDSNDIIVHCDGDVLFSASIEQPVELVRDSGFCAGYMPTRMKFKHHIRHRRKLEQLTRTDLRCIDSESTLAGSFFVLHGSELIKKVFTYAVDQWGALRDLLYTEESIMFLSHVLHNAPYVILDWSANWPLETVTYLNQFYVVPSINPIDPRNGAPLLSVHFSNSKWIYTNLAGRAHTMWKAWQHIADRYKDILWDRIAR